MSERDVPQLPGHDLVVHGLRDLARGEETECSLLVLIAAPRLRKLGIQVPESKVSGPVEHRLYERLEERLGAGAHSYYNSLIRRIVSYAHALDRKQAA